jgi:acetolactate synthase-1/2/3 large subunit
VDILRTSVKPELVLDEWLAAKAPRKVMPSEDAVAAAVDAIRSARRILVISGRGARRVSAAVVDFLDATGALYLDTQESRGLVPSDHPSVVGAVRAAAMGQADLVITLGRKLDYQLGYGSPAVFAQARFLRIADTPKELIDNRRGTPEVLGDVGATLSAITSALGGDAGAVDTPWADGLRTKHRARITKGATTAAPQTGEDGKIHPRAIFDALRGLLKANAIGVADGGDFLSFARVGLTTSTYMDAGVFGCLGVGVPFAMPAPHRWHFLIGRWSASPATVPMGSTR